MPKIIPLTAELADVLIERLTTLLQNGGLDLPGLQRLKATETHALWKPSSDPSGSNPLKADQYVIGASREYVRHGSGPPVGAQNRHEATDIYQLRIRVMSKIRVELSGSAAELFKAAFIKAICGLLFQLQDENEANVTWLRGYAENSEFTSDQIDWIEWTASTVVRAPTRTAQGQVSRPKLRIGDTIFHGDSAGNQGGVITLFVKKDDSTFALSAAHVVTFYGHAAPETDVFALRARVRDPMRRIGQFSEPTSLQGAFQPTSSIDLDAALVRLAVENAENEFAIDGHLQKVDKIVNWSPRSALPAPPVMIVRSGQQLQMAQVVGTGAALPFLTNDDELVFYSGLDELRRLKSSDYTVPKDFQSVVKAGSVLTRPGDSGSLVVAIEENSFDGGREFSACGLIVGGNGEGSHTGVAYSIPLHIVQEKLVFNDLVDY